MQVPLVSSVWLAKIKDPPNQLAAGRRTLNTQEKKEEGRNASGPSCRRQRHPIDRSILIFIYSTHTHTWFTRIDHIESGSRIASLARAAVYRRWQEDDWWWPEKIQSPVVNLSTGQISQSDYPIASHGSPLKWTLHCSCFHRIATQISSAHRVRAFFFVCLPCAGACTTSTRLIFFWLRQPDRRTVYAPSAYGEITAVEPLQKNNHCYPVSSRHSRRVAVRRKEIA